MQDYAGQVISRRSSAAVRRPVIERLAALGYALPPDGDFGSLVRLYQSQHVDAAGNPLLEDGLVGRTTWASLFGAADTHVPPRGLGGQALLVAASQIGVREQPIGSNRGPQVDAYLASAGAPPGSFWCMAFVVWCFREATRERGIADPFPTTASCLRAWAVVAQAMPDRIVTRDQALADPTRVRPGSVFILEHGGGLGHTGFVSRVVDGALTTIEGNSNIDGSRNGVGVFELNRRRTTAPQVKGFIDFTEVAV